MFDSIKEWFKHKPSQIEHQQYGSADPMNHNPIEAAQVQKNFTEDATRAQQSLETAVKNPEAVPAQSIETNPEGQPPQPVVEPSKQPVS